MVKFVNKVDFRCAVRGLSGISAGSFTHNLIAKRYSTLNEHQPSVAMVLRVGIKRLFSM
jgi:hypothetical protein